MPVLTSYQTKQITVCWKLFLCLTLFSLNTGHVDGRLIDNEKMRGATVRERQAKRKKIPITDQNTAFKYLSPNEPKVIINHWLPCNWHRTIFNVKSIREQNSHRSQIYHVRSVVDIQSGRWVGSQFIVIVELIQFIHFEFGIIIKFCKLRHCNWFGKRYISVSFEKERLWFYSGRK